MRNGLVRALFGLSILGALISPALGASPYYKDVCASNCTYSSVQAAIDSITDSSAAKVYTIFIDSGVLQSDTSTKTNGKGYINFVGRGAGISVLQASPAWYANVASATTAPEFFDLSGSNHVTVTNLTIDARTTDPGNVSTSLNFVGVKADPGDGGRILFDGCEIQGINFGLWDGSTAGALIDVVDSKIQAASIAIYAAGSHWHIYSSELRVMDAGGTSGTVTTAATVYAYLGEVTIWGSHVHLESSQNGVRCNISAITNVTSPSVTVSVIGSTLHLKMTTDIPSSTCYNNVANATQGTASFIGTEFLYENTGGPLSQGRISGLKLGGLPTVNVTGCTFRDGGGTGGTSRVDLLVPPTASALKLRVAGTQFASMGVILGTTLPINVIRGLSTAATQRGSASFTGSGSVAVTLPVALPNATYNVTVSSTYTTPAETFTVTGQTATGFTINSSNSSSNSTVMWFLN